MKVELMVSVMDRESSIRIITMKGRLDFRTKTKAHWFAKTCEERMHLLSLLCLLE